MDIATNLCAEADANTACHLPKEPPVAEAGAAGLKFIRSISTLDLHSVCFDETLVTYSNVDKEVGQLRISISSSGCEDECFTVKACSEGVVDGKPCGTAVTAFVNNHGETLHQQYHEFVRLDNRMIERDTEIVRKEDHYAIQQSLISGQDVRQTSRTLSFDSMNGVITEGSNLLLLRLIATKGLPDGGLDLLTVYSDLTICPVQYRALESESEMVSGQEVKYDGIARTMFCDREGPLSWHTHFLSDGHMVKRAQVGSVISMRVRSLAAIIGEDEADQKPTFGKKPLIWDQDLELNSKFMDRKEELKADHATYMRQHPELRAVVADFLQHVLVRQPKDVLTEASNYFVLFRKSDSDHSSPSVIDD